MAEKGPKIFRALCAVVLEVSKQTMVKKAVRNKNGRKRAEKFSRFMRHFPTTFPFHISSLVFTPLSFFYTLQYVVGN